MSGTTPAPPHPGFDPKTNPKAAAKAAKAYAKASRPWFKKKRWWLAGIIVLIVIIAVASNSGSGGPNVVNQGSQGGQSNSSSTDSSGKADLGTKENPAKVGQTVELAGTQYTVKKAKTAAKIGDPTLLGAKANGRFVVVKLTIENMKNETKTFSQDATKFIAPTGSSYSPDDNGTMAAMGNNQEPLWLADMQPQLPKTGVIVFDVPPTALKGGLLEVSDLFGAGSAYINLGVK